MPTFHRSVTGARAYFSGHFELEIDGTTSTAYVKAAGGSWPQRNVADEPRGGEIQRIKHGTTIEIDPIELEIGMAQSDYLMHWIACSWDRRFARHNGAIVHGDFNYACSLIHEFKQALIEE